MLPEEKRIHTKADLKRFLDIEFKKYAKTNKIFLPFRENDVLAKYNYILRKCEYHKNTNHKFRSRYYAVRLGLMQNKYGIRIPINTCDQGLKIMHIGSILINSNSVIGKDCSIHINTGIIAGGVNSAAPVLGDGVVVGFGAVIVGGVKIADNVAMGANAVVTKDVDEENIAVGGVPAKKVSDNGRLKWNKK